ncbi:MAG: hypothetical protein Q7R66_14365 [Undibacterium sp.]|uniref:hypothetical protein n=1 Tax=Undibacterium sp. TaxID=1914977 RepID=UPI0027206314|nr:hypothetical protein [Undibacterium sp.]MDO8653366.1 hypothetical protein [Undibacterium sp.]
MQGSTISCHIAFGLQWDSTIYLTQFSEHSATDTLPDIKIRVLDDKPLERELIAMWGRSEVFDNGFRFYADDFALFDFYLPDRLDVFLGSAWDGDMPSFFYGTVVAAILAFKGRIPIHGSAVEIDGRAVLICGHSGLGKSSIASSLIGFGGKMISDDLSALCFETDGRVLLHGGRTNVRLAAPAAKKLSDSEIFNKKIGTNLFGKYLVEMLMVPPSVGVPLDAIIFLDSKFGKFDIDLHPFQNYKKLLSNLFRPGLMNYLPYQRERVQKIMNLNREVRFLGLQVHPPIDGLSVKNMTKQIFEFFAHGK